MAGVNHPIHLTVPKSQILESQQTSAKISFSDRSRQRQYVDRSDHMHQDVSPFYTDIG